MDMKIQTLDTIKEILGQVKFRDWEFRVSEYHEIPFLQIVFMAPDTETQEGEMQFCRKWALQYVMCDTEVIRTAWLAVQQAIMHETQEEFLFDGVRVFDPHHDLVMLSKTIEAGYIPQQTRIEV